MTASPTERALGAGHEADLPGRHPPGGGQERGGGAVLASAWRGSGDAGGGGGTGGGKDTGAVEEVFVTQAHQILVF